MLLKKQLTPYTSLLELLILYCAGVIVVALVLGWNLIASWIIFLGLTSVVLLSAFRSMFPSTRQIPKAQHRSLEAPISKRMRELESAIAAGFRDGDLSAQKKTLETIHNVFVSKVKRTLALSESDLKALIENPAILEDTIGGAELARLVSGKLGPERSKWNFSSLSDLISRVEEWGS